jgi:hypothetical protein
VAQDEDADEDMGALAAMGSLRAIATILESVSSLPAERLALLYPELEALCMPIMVRAPPPSPSPSSFGAGWCISVLPPPGDLLWSLWSC